MSQIADSDKFLHKQHRQVLPPSRRKLGEILVEREIVTKLTVERALGIGRRTGKRLGTVLEDLGLVTGEELAEALAAQYGYSIVRDFARYRFPDQLLQLMPPEVAAEHLVFPLKIQGETLALAMADPTNEKIVQNLKTNPVVSVRPFVAAKREIRKAINRHYLRASEGEEKPDTVLLVEDDKLIVATVGDILRRAGFAVVAAADGMEAFKKALCCKPDLIITDKVMPKLDGYLLLNSLRGMSETREIPVILMSGSANPEEEVVAFDKGFFDYVQKPVRDKILLTKVKRALKCHKNVFALA